MVKQALVTILVLVAAVSAAQAQNLIQNGTFEDGANIGTDWFSGTEASLGVWIGSYNTTVVDDPRAAAGVDVAPWNRTLLVDNHVMEHFKWGVNMSQYVGANATAGDEWSVAFDFLKEFDSQFQVRVYGLTALPASGWGNAAGNQAGSVKLWDSQDPNMDGSTANAITVLTSGAAVAASGLFTDATGFAYYQWRITGSDSGGYSNTMELRHWFDNVVLQAGALNVPGDANGDGVCDVGDLGILGANYNTAVTGGPAEADFNNDGMCDVGDLGILGANYTSGAAVPEPATLSLLGLGVLALRRRR